MDSRDVGVVQRGEDFGFALKPREPVAIRHHGGRQDLDSHLALQLGIGGPIHLAHASATQQFRQLEHA